MKAAEKSGKSTQKTKFSKQVLESVIKGDVSEEERFNMIRDAAYLRAEQRNFEGGDPLQDWLSAEDDIKNQLGI